MSNSLGRWRERCALDLDTVFEVLSHSRHRQLLTALYTIGKTATVDELAAEMVTLERKDPQTVASQQDQLAVALRRTYVPELQERGILTYDRESDTVSLTPQARPIRAYLPDVSVGARAWYLYYLLIGLSGIILTGITLSNLWVFGRLDPDFVAVIVILAFTALASCNAIYQRCYCF